MDKGNNKNVQSWQYIAKIIGGVEARLPLMYNQRDIDVTKGTEVPSKPSLL